MCKYRKKILGLKFIIGNANVYSTTSDRTSAGVFTVGEHTEQPHGLKEIHKSQTFLLNAQDAFVLHAILLRDSVMQQLANQTGYNFIAHPAVMHFH